MTGINRLLNRIDVIADAMDDLLNRNPRLSFKEKKKYRAIAFYSQEDREREDYEERRLISRFTALMNESKGLVRESIRYLEMNGMKHTFNTLEQLEKRLCGSSPEPKDVAYFLRECSGTLRAIYLQIDQ